MVTIHCEFSLTSVGDLIDFTFCPVRFASAIRGFDSDNEWPVA